MARKPKRPEPLSEGSLADIYRHFLGPLIRYKPNSLSIKDWMEVIFDSSNRDVTRYVCKAAFKMPGLYYAAAGVKVQGIGYRQVEPGTVLWVRMDARQPDVVDVELFTGQGGKDQIFCLTRSEWSWVALHLDEAERQRKEK
jgi:hypothetical protein